MSDPLREAARRVAGPEREDRWAPQEKEKEPDKKKGRWVGGDEFHMESFYSGLIVGVTATCILIYLGGIFADRGDLSIYFGTIGAVGIGILWFYDTFIRAR